MNLVSVAVVDHVDAEGFAAVGSLEGILAGEVLGTEAKLEGIHLD